MATAKGPGSVLRRVLGILAAVFIGSVLGAGVQAATVAQVPSYFGSDPLTCANCHVMQDYYDGWSYGSHARVATCNDCHLPPSGLIAQYMVKAEDGFLHAYKFTTGDYPTNIVIRESNRAIVNAACLGCHTDMTSEIRADVGGSQVNRTTVTCTRCHETTGHK